MKRHVTANEVYEFIKEAYPTIGKGTVLPCQVSKVWRGFRCGYGSNTGFTGKNS